MTDRIEITTPDVLEDEAPIESSLRPQRLAEFIGQEKVCESLAIAIEAANQRREPLDHVLFHGPPGLGKTTLASLMARELSVNIKTTSGPVLEKPADLVGILTNQREGDILFIDEIHRLRPVIEEFLYPAMEDWKVDIRLADGPKAETMTMPIEKFTLIGATTRFGLLTAPMRARFGIVQRLNFYPPHHLATIVRRSADILGIETSPDGADELAARARGTPRVANRLLRRVRDYAEVRADGRIDHGVAKAALELLDVDQYGLDEMDSRILKTLIEKFGGGPVGLGSLAVALGEDTATLEEVYEPFLIQEGFLMRTSRGRVATARSWRRLGITPPAGAAFQHLNFPDLLDFLAPGDLLVVNESRVLPARLQGLRATGGKAEVLLLHPVEARKPVGDDPSGAEGESGRADEPDAPGDSDREAGRRWTALVRPGRKVKMGDRVTIDPSLEVEMVDAHDPAGAGVRQVRLVTELDPIDAIHRHGSLPLPPYLGREAEPEDRERYQTVFARIPGSVAAPTAGLHFTPELLDRIASLGVARAEVTLHVGAGTFRPVEVEDPEAHEMHAESWEVSEAAAAAVRDCRARGGRVWAVGTTVVRTLESAVNTQGEVASGRGSTRLFIRPPFRFRVVDGLLTNFHLPRSTLMMLVAALAGYPRTIEAYASAVAEGYRFYSYGDAMLILPGRPR